MLSPADIADALAAAIAARVAALEAEQAPTGIDALEELALHPLLADGLAGAGYGVAREQRYPGMRGRRRLSEGDRCDLVVTAGGRPLVVEAARATLFEPDDAAELDEALWLEVKTVAQFVAGGANGGWTTQLLRAARADVRKLARATGVRDRALALLLFVADEAVAAHDLSVWERACLDDRLPIGVPSRRTVAIPDHLGNVACVVAVYPVHELDDEAS